jgi:Glucose / Sorbosone dehydrogenase/FlgD Ig-like domain
MGQLLSGLVMTLAITPDRASAQVHLPVGFQDEVRADSLDKPTSLAFLPDGRVLITEQWTGNIRLVTAGSVIVHDPVYTFPDVSQNYERGLLSIAVDPGWPVRPFIYCHYTANGDIVRLVRLTGQRNLSDPTGTTLQFGSPYVVLDSLPDAQPYHNGGAARFGKDGMLYLSLGDDGSACLAQDSTSLHGCVLRLNVDALPNLGTGPADRELLAPPGNPYASSPVPDAHLEYAIGFRNPFRFQIDPDTGVLYVSDVGEDTWEELDAVTAGVNAGWPHREALALVDYPFCSEPGGLGANQYLTPIDYYEHPLGVVIVSAGIIRHSRGPTLWPTSWEGNVLYADFMVGWMRMLHPESDGTWTRIPTGGSVSFDFFADNLSYPTDFQWGPDGDLWWTSYGNDSWDPGSGTLHRMYCDVVELAAAPAERHDRPLQLRAMPNPARGPMAFSAVLSTRERVLLTVHDIAGRRVVTLLDADREPGVVQVAWDGRDEHGRPVPSGLYLARIEAGSRTSTTRIVQTR